MAFTFDRGLVVFLARRFGAEVPFLARLGIFRHGVFGCGAGRMRAVAQILQSLLGRIAVDQLDRVEVAGNGGLGLLIGCVDEPHDEEEAHHRRHEVGEGDFPDASMVTFIVIAVATSNDDDFMPGFFVRSDAHASISESTVDHSDRRVSNRSPSMLTTRSKPGASIKSNSPARSPSALLNATKSDCGPRTSIRMASRSVERRAN